MISADKTTSLSLSVLRHLEALSYIWARFYVVRRGEGVDQHYSSRTPLFERPSGGLTWNDNPPTPRGPFPRTMIRFGLATFHSSDIGPWQRTPAPFRVKQVPNLGIICFT